MRVSDVRRARMRRLLPACLLPVAVALATCDDDPIALQEGPPVRALALIELTFENVGRPDMSSDVDVLATLAGDGADLDFDTVATGLLTLLAGTEPSVRFIHATWRIRGAVPVVDTVSPHLTLVAIATETTIAGTPFRLFQRADGSAADPQLTLGLIPRGYMVLDADGRLIERLPSVLRELGNAEMERVSSAAASVGDVVAHGFNVQLLGPSTIAGVELFDAAVTVTYSIPVVDPEFDNPTTISVMFLLVEGLDG